jgi:hypothetical protein
MAMAIDMAMDMGMVLMAVTDTEDTVIRITTITPTKKKHKQVKHIF